MKTGRKRIELTLKKVKEIFNDELIDEVCEIYTQLIIDAELNDDILHQLTKDYEELFNDYKYDGQYTWIAIAYTQFELGFLIPEIKEKAIATIKDELNKITHSNKAKLTKEQLLEFHKILNSPLPKKVIIKKPKYYTCNWQIGDVFAIKLNRDIYEEYGLQGKYIMFVKVDEFISYPKHICPKILIYNWYGDEPIFDIEYIKKLDFLPTSLVRNYINYKVFLTIESEKELKKVDIKYLGNVKNLKFTKELKEDIANENSKQFSSLKTLSSHMIPIKSFIKMGYKITPNDNQIVDLK
jgi:hypothetical protein